jgi:hypothetical protein
MSVVLIMGHYCACCVLKLMTHLHKKSDLYVYIHLHSLLCNGFVEQICFKATHIVYNLHHITTFVTFEKE